MKYHQVHFCVSAWVIGDHSAPSLEARPGQRAEGAGRYVGKIEGTKEKGESPKSVLGIVMLTIGSYRAKSLKG